MDDKSMLLDRKTHEALGNEYLGQIQEKQLQIQQKMQEVENLNREVLKLQGKFEKTKEILEQEVKADSYADARAKVVGESVA